MLVRIFMIIAVCSFAAPGFAYVQWTIDCNTSQDGFDIAVEVFNQYIEGDVTGYELLFEQSAVGTCDAPEIFLSEPLPAPFDGVQLSFSRPAPDANQYYKFRVLLRAPDGTVTDPGFPNAPSWNVASCGEAVAVRGFLVDAGYQGFLNVLPCPDSCETWLCPMYVDLSQVPVEQWQPYVGTDVPVDVYGSPYLYPMAGSPCLVGDEVRLTATEDCGPVAIDVESWGGLKARYR